MQSRTKARQPAAETVRKFPVSAELRMATTSGCTASGCTATSTQSPPLQKLLHRHRSAPGPAVAITSPIAPVRYYCAASGPEMLSTSIRSLSNGKLRHKLLASSMGPLILMRPAPTDGAGLISIRVPVCRGGPGTRARAARPSITPVFSALDPGYEFVPLRMSIGENGPIRRLGIPQEHLLSPRRHPDATAAIAHARRTPWRCIRIHRTRTFHYMESSVRTWLMHSGATFRRRAHAHP